MTMGTSEKHDDLFRSVHELCDASVGERSLFRLLAEQGHLLFPDAMFVDLYSSRGRRSIAPRVMATLDRHRKNQRGDAWKKRYRKVRPRVERKIAHLMRRKHGGRRARLRGRERVQQDFALLAASINLARLAALGVRIAPAARGV
jgi:hypothetical protein